MLAAPEQEADDGEKNQDFDDPPDQARIGMVVAVVAVVATVLHAATAAFSTHTGQVQAVPRRLTQPWMVRA